MADSYSRRFCDGAAVRNFGERQPRRRANPPTRPHPFLPPSSTATPASRTSRPSRANSTHRNTPTWTPTSTASCSRRRADSSPRKPQPQNAPIHSGASRRSNAIYNGGLRRLHSQTTSLTTAATHAISAWTTSKRTSPYRCSPEASQQEGVISVRTITPPQPAQGTVISDGVAAARRILLGTPPDVRGQGVKIGIIDTGFESFQTLMGTELPTTVAGEMLHRHRRVQHFKPVKLRQLRMKASTAQQ